MTGRHGQPPVPSPRTAPDDDGAEGSHQQLRTELTVAGWALVSERHGYAQRWRSPSGLVWIVVPLDVTAGDYGDRLTEAWTVWAQVLADAGYRS